MAPIISSFKEEGVGVVVVVTAQHRDLLDQTLAVFNIKPDYDLDVMRENQTLNGVAEAILRGIGPILQREGPDYLFVQGDTTTAFIAGLAAFYSGIKLVHIEAGLRTGDKKSPFPEEINRQLISRLADIHFAPTITAQQNLLREGIPTTDIYVVGNTEIDTLLKTIEYFKHPTKEVEMVEKLKIEYGLELEGDKKIILVTAHRRESFNGGLEGVCWGLREIAQAKKDVSIIYSVHPNPNVRRVVEKILRGVENIFLVPALDYESFVFLMTKCYLVITDSGGVQESAPSLNKPVLIIREKTERMEAVEVGLSILVGTNKEKIVSTTLDLLENSEKYSSMTNKPSPFGDGFTSKKIVKILLENYLK